MTTLNNKIDFAVIVCVNNANPNGDPLNGNRPRSRMMALANCPMCPSSAKSGIA